MLLFLPFVYQGIAGNIIPAIATTNAIVAGIQVLQAFKLINEDPAVLSNSTSTSATTDGVSSANGDAVKSSADASNSTSNSDSNSSNAVVRRICRHTYCLRMPTRRGYYLQPSEPEDPEPSCYVCNISQLTVQVRVNLAAAAKLWYPISASHCTALVAIASSLNNKVIILATAKLLPISNDRATSNVALLLLLS
jgi:hypothetical protein